MPNIILFDLDDTILDFHKSEKAAITETMSQLGAPVSEQNIALYSKINDSMWKKLERGELTRAQVLLNRFEEFFGAIGIECSPLSAKKLYEHYLSEQCFFIDGDPGSGADGPAAAEVVVAGYLPQQRSACGTVECNGGAQGRFP